MPIGGPGELIIYCSCKMMGLHIGHKRSSRRAVALVPIVYKISQNGATLRVKSSDRPAGRNELMRVLQTQFIFDQDQIESGNLAAPDLHLLSTLPTKRAYGGFLTVVCTAPCTPDPENLVTSAIPA